MALEWRMFFRLSSRLREDNFVKSALSYAGVKSSWTLLPPSFARDMSSLLVKVAHSTMMVIIPPSRVDAICTSECSSENRSWEDLILTCAPVLTIVLRSE